MAVTVAASAVRVAVAVLECVDADQVDEEAQNRHHEQSLVLDLRTRRS